MRPNLQGPQTGEIQDALADSPAREVFGYNPRYPVEEGLRQAVARFRERA